MASPFKTHETMDLARALLEEESLQSRRDDDSDEQTPTEYENGNGLDQTAFRALVVTKDSSTELIPTNFVESSGTPASHNRPPLMMMRDMNAGKGLVDDDGKPVVGKVFSRVIQVAGENQKPKQLKPRRQPRREDGCCSGSGGCCSTGKQEGAGNKQERGCSGCSCSSPRPQSSSGQRSSTRGTNSNTATINNLCPTCNRQFSDETMKHHIIFCTGNSREIM